MMHHWGYSVVIVSKKSEGVATLISESVKSFMFLVIITSAFEAKAQKYCVASSLSFHSEESALSIVVVSMTDILQKRSNSLSCDASSSTVYEYFFPTYKVFMTLISEKQTSIFPASA